MVQTSTKQPPSSTIPSKAGNRLLVVADRPEAASSADEVPGADDGATRAEDHPAARVRQDGLNRVTIVAHRHFSVARSGIPEFDGFVIRSSKDLVR